MDNSISTSSGSTISSSNYSVASFPQWYEGYQIQDEMFYTAVPILLIYVIVGIPGNLLIIASLIKNRQLGSSYNILVGNLAVSDLLLTAYIVLFDVVDLLYGRFPGPFALCQFNAFMLISLKTVSISSLMVIAVNRCCQICYFSMCHKIFTRKKTYIICASQWIYGWVLAGLPLFCWSTLKYDKLIHECSYDRFASTSYTIVLVGTVIAIPVSISLTCYVKILLALFRRNAKVGSQLQSGILQRHIRELKSVKTQLAVFITFMMVTTPYGLTAMLADDSEDLVVLHAMVNILGHANSVINCFIYGIMNKRIRTEYKDILLCKKYQQQNNNPASALGSNNKNATKDSIV